MGDREGAEPGAAPRYNCETRRDGDRATMRVRWFVLVDAIGLALTALLFNALWLSQGFGAILTGDREWLLRGFALLFIAIGVGAAYATLAHLLNTTTLSIDRERVTVRHGPMPWPGGGAHPRKGIAAIEVKRKIRRWGDETRRGVTHDILARVGEGAPLTLLTGLRHGEQASHIARELADCLGVADDVASSPGAAS